VAALGFRRQSGPSPQRASQLNLDALELLLRDDRRMIAFVDRVSVSNKSVCVGVGKTVKGEPRDFQNEMGSRASSSVIKLSASSISVMVAA
jgi:hypothetical protein